MNCLIVLRAMTRINYYSPNLGLIAKAAQDERPPRHWSGSSCSRGGLYRVASGLGALAAREMRSLPHVHL